MKIVKLEDHLHAALAGLLDEKNIVGYALFTINKDGTALSDIAMPNNDAAVKLIGHMFIEMTSYSAIIAKELSVQG